MTEPAGGPTLIPLADQIVEVEKTIRERGRTYPDLVARGRLLPETADQKLAALRAAQTTLTWLEQNEHWIKPEAERRRAAKKAAADAEAIRAEMEKHPVVAMVTRALDAEVAVPIEPDLFPRDTAPLANERAATA